MGIFKGNLGPEELRNLEQQIEKRVKERAGKHGNYVEEENKLAAPVVNYSDREMENVPYELFMARKYVKMFPEEEFGPPKRFSGLRSFFQRVVRRILRQQIVFNEFMLGAMEELNQRLISLEEETKSLENKKSKKGRGDDSK